MRSGLRPAAQLIGRCKAKYLLLDSEQLRQFSLADSALHNQWPGHLAAVQPASLSVSTGQHCNVLGAYPPAGSKSQVSMPHAAD